MGDRDDAVHPIDRKLQGILARIADSTPDPNVRHTAMDLQLTVPPVHDWSDEQLLSLYERCAFIIMCLQLRVPAPYQPRHAAQRPTL